MNQLPIVTISRSDGGHRIVCTCSWTSFRYCREDADLLAMSHRASHGQPDRPKKKEATN